MISSLCRAPIDWSATGSMLSGIGSLTAAVLLLVAANIGRSTFNDWRRQKQEGRRIDLAEQILAHAYKLKRAFAAIRSPAMFGWETNEVMTKLRETGEVDDDTPHGIISTLAIAQAALSRVDFHRPDFEALNNIRPIGKAVFGGEMEELLDVFWEQRARVIQAAQRYARDARHPEPRDERAIERSNQRRDEAEAILWDGGGADGIDQVGDHLSRAISRLEAILLPMIRADF